MAQEWAKAFYKSRRWIKCKNNYIADRRLVDGGLCEECQKQLGYIVHHKILLTQDNISNPDISLNHDNLEYVCKDCHDKFDGHGVSKGQQPLCIFDKDGNPISVRDIDSPLKNRWGIDEREPIAEIDVTHRSS